MTAMTMIEAIRDAHVVAMERDDDVVVFGEDVGYFGGVFRCTQGLQERFGDHRCFDSPISEAGIVGAAVGMAAYGLRPCVEIQFADYMYPAYDQIVSEAARLRHRSAGDFTAPLVVRMPTGGGIYGGQTHSQSPEALFAHVAGLKTVVVSNPYDAKGLLIAAIEDDDPVIFLEPKRVYNGPFDGHHDRPIVPWSKHPLGEVPEGHYTIDIGTARTHRQGTELTVLTYGTLVHVARDRGRGTGHRCRDHRSAHPRPARRRRDRDVGREDGALSRRARSDAHLRLRRGAERHRAGTLPVPPRSTDRQGLRMGHAVSPRARVVLLPRTGTRRPGDARVGRSVSRFDMKLPDVGEGVAEAEMVEWFVGIGDRVTPDTVIAEVLTDKATVEVSSPVDGIVVELHGEPATYWPSGAT